MKKLALLLALVLSLPVLAQTTRPVPRPIIGVWMQPTSSFVKWKARGINTVVGLELEGGNVKADDWVKAAHDAGLYVVANNTNADVFQQPDEPDIAEVTETAKQPPAIQNNYKVWKTAYPSKPVFMSLSGTKMQWRAAADYVEYVRGADWISQDTYPANSGSIPPDDVITSLQGWDFYVSRVQTLWKLGAGKPVFTFIECSDQDLRVGGWLHIPENQPQGELWASRMRAPTPDEMEKEVTLSFSNGGVGIIYFAHIIGLNFESFDGVTPALEARMISINTRLVAAANPPVILPPTTQPATPSTGVFTLTPLITGPMAKRDIKFDIDFKHGRVRGTRSDGSTYFIPLPQ